MGLIRRYLMSSEDTKEQSNSGASVDIPEDDGHQMSQSEIDDLIAKLLNQ